MEPFQGIDSGDELRELGLRPKEWTARKTAIAYGSAIFASGILCAHFYTEPSIVKPCEDQAAMVHIYTSTSSSSFSTLTSVVVASANVA